MKTIYITLGIMALVNIFLTICKLQDTWVYTETLAMTLTLITILYCRISKIGESIMKKKTSVRKSIKKNKTARNIWQFIVQTYKNALEHPESYLEDDLFLAEARLEIILNVSNKRIRRFVIRQMNEMQKEFIQQNY